MIKFDVNTTHSSISEQGEPGSLRGELTVPSVSMQDGGRYTCLASNSYGTEQYHMTLTVAGEGEVHVFVILWLEYSVL